jgi:intracellular multiplication protein IcmD
MTGSKRVGAFSTFKKIVCWLFLLFTNTFTYAASKDLGSIALQITAPVQQATHLLQIICILCGIALSMSSLLKYKAHRNNPQEVPFSTPIMLLLFGLGLLALAFIPPLVLGKK